jgi:octaprenyl-diphosphate synthase
VDKEADVTTVSKPIDVQPFLQSLYEPIADEMKQVERLLRQEMSSQNAYVDELVRYGVMLGGKRLRPALLLLVAKSLGNVTPEHLTLAAVVEMIHTATLVHDDVLDDAETRRHLATVNSRWDNKASVLLGDFLFTHAFYLASTLSSTWACRTIGLATNRVCEGEMRQKGSIGDFDLSEEEYIDIISSKTAELCACSCELGARYTGASPEVVSAMANFGRDLGIAFQIADDILDVTGDEETTGKSLGTDMAQQKPTLPIIRLLECVRGGERDQVFLLLQSDVVAQIPDLRQMFERYETILYSRKKALEYAQRAQRQLEVLSPSPARDTLTAMASFVVARTQ